MDERFVISIILRARDEASEALSRVREEVEKLSGESRSVSKSTDEVAASTDKLGQASDETGKKVRQSKDDLHQLKLELDDVGDSAQDVSEKGRQLKADWEKLNNDFRQGRKKVDDYTEGLRRLNSEFTKLSRKEDIGSAIAEDMARAARLTKQSADNFSAGAKLRLRTLDEQDAASAKSEASARKQLKAEQDLGNRIERTTATYREFNDELASGSMSREQATSELRRFGAEFGALAKEFPVGSREARQFGAESERTKNVLAGFRRETSDSTGWMQRWERSISDSGSSLAALQARLRGLVIVLVVTFAQQLITVLVGLAGELVSVASSAVLAGAALGGALAAGISQAIPFVALLVAAFQRVGHVIDAVKQSNLLAEQTGSRQANSSRQQAGAADALANAQDGVVAAQDRVTEALERENEAQRSLRQARREARLEILANNLALEDSEERLRQAVAAGETAEIPGAELGVLQAREQVRDTSHGVEGTERVRNARDQVDQARKGIEDAEKAVTRARRSVDAARRSASAAGEDSLAAAGKLNFLVEQLSPAERKLYETLRRIQSRYKEVFGPITDIIVGSFDRASTRLHEMLGDESFVAPFRGLSRQIADSVDEATGSLTDDRTLSQFALFTNEAKRNLEPLTEAGLSLSHVFFNIAESAAPMFRRMSNDIARFADKLELASMDTEGLSGFFQRAYEHLKGWVSLLGASAGLLRTLVDLSADSGLDSIGDVTRNVREATEWLRAHAEETRTFFEGSREVTGQVGRVLFELAKAMVRVFSPEHVEILADFIVEVLIPAIEDIITGLGIVLDIILRLATFFGPITQLVIVLGTFVRIMNTLKALFLGSVLGAAQFGQGLSTMIGPASKLGVVVGGLGKAFAALIGGKGIGGAIAAMKSYRAEQALVATSTAKAKTVTGATATGGGTVLLPDGRTVVAGSPAHKQADLDTKAKQRSSTRRKVVGGVGALALFAGSQALSAESDQLGELGPQTSRNITELGSSFKDLNRNVKDTFSSLISLDIGGIINSWSRDTNGLREFVDEADQSFKRFVEDRNVKGLTDLRDRANELAEDFPDFAEELGAMADKFELGRQNAIGQNRQLNNMGEIVRRLKRQGLNISVDLQLKTPKNLLDDIEFFMRRLRQGIPRSMRELRRELNAELARIGQLPGGKKNPEFFTLMAEATQLGIRNIRRLQEANKISGEQAERWIRALRREVRLFRSQDADALGVGFARQIRAGDGDRQREIDRIVNQLGQMPPAARRIAGEMAVGMAKRLENQGKIPEGVARRLASDIGVRFRDMRDVNVERARQMIFRMGGHFQTLPGLVYEGLDQVNKNMRTVLEALGAKPLNILLEKAKPLKSMSQLSREQGGAAVGGFIGMQGERGADGTGGTVGGHPVGRGELLVANWQQQRLINSALHAQFGFGTHDLVRRVRGEHAGWAPGGFAGGFAGESPAGLRTVPIPGFSGEFVAQKVLGTLLALVNRFDLFVTDAFATSGHKGAGHLTFGTAADVVPNFAAGGSWDKVDAAVEFARSRGMTVLYDGVSGHGRGDHAHIELQPGLRGAASQRLEKIGVRGPDGAIKEITQRMLDRAVRAANRRIAREEAGAGYAPGHAPEGALSEAEAARIFTRAFKLAGVEMQPGYLNNLINLAKEESSLRPGAQNKTPAGLAAGLPQGILQVVIDTFKAFALKGHNNPFNPLHNAIASIRYQMERYGTIQRHAPYAAGGVVTGGGEGQPRDVTAHVGEWVLNKPQQDRAARALGTTRDVLAEIIGLPGRRSGRSFEGGGEIGAEAASRRRRHRNRELPEYEIPDELPETFRGIIREIKKAFDTLKRLKPKTEKATEQFADVIREITDEGKLLDSATAALERWQTDVASALRRQTFRIVNSGRRVIRRLDESDVLERELRNLRNETEKLTDERGLVVRTLRSVRRRLRRSGLSDTQGRQLEQVEKRLDAKGDDKPDKEETEELKKVRDRLLKRKTHDNLLSAAETRLETELRTLDGLIGENIASRFEQQRALAEARINEVNERAEIKTGRLDIRGRIAEMFGRVDDVASIAGKRIEVIGRQMAELAELKKREKNPEVRRMIQAQIDELDATAQELYVQQFAAATEQINEAAGTRLGRLDLQERMLSATGAVGQFAAGSVGINRQQIFAERGSVLSSQREALQGQLLGAQITGNEAAVKELTSQIEELGVAIVENTSAAFAARVEDVNATATYANTINGLQSRILELKGELGGVVDAEGLRRLLVEREMILGNQRSGLEQLLAEAQASGNQQAINELNQQLLENQVAILENTQAINEMNSTLTEPQSFSSTLWQTFRQAIFTGSGGLLGNYPVVPSLDAGGVMTKTGLAYLHAGEAVSKPSDWGRGDVHLNIDHPVQVFDPDVAAERFAWRFKQKVASS